MKVVLVGYMASGKSSVGKLLAQEMSMDFIDLDEYMEHHLQKTIGDIFSEKGEIFFRKTEHAMLSEVLDQHDNVVLSTGGGTPCYGNNMDLVLEKSDHSIYLQLPISVLVERVKGEQAQRPLIKDIAIADLPEFIGKHLFERRQFYTRAKHTVSCDGKDLGTVVSEIRELLI